jgi:hypothetical protein
MPTMSLKERLALKAKELAEKAAQSTPVATEAKKETNVTHIAEAISSASSTSLQQTDSEIPKSDSSIEILAKIRELKELSGEDLGNAMLDLKKALMANPDACAVMLPEDIGEMVSNLRRLTGQTIAEAVVKKEKKPKAKALTKEEMEQAFDEL